MAGYNIVTPTDTGTTLTLTRPLNVAVISSALPWVMTAYSSALAAYVVWTAPQEDPTGVYATVALGVQQSDLSRFAVLREGR